MDGTDNIYSAANIERSRGRARQFRYLVSTGELPESYSGVADAIDADALERELMTVNV
jgi:hypothetical protein